MPRRDRLTSRSSRFKRPTSRSWPPRPAKLFPEEFAAALIRAIPYRPSVAITFRVEEVFLQTPGPGAGSKLA